MALAEGFFVVVVIVVVVELALPGSSYGLPGEKVVRFRQWLRVRELYI